MTAWEPAAFVKLLGVKIILRSAQRSEAELFVRDELCNRRNVMHGGAIMGWSDTMGGMTTTAALPSGHRTATIESKTNFFAPIPKGDTARAVTTPLHIGRTTIVMQTTITRGDGRLAAITTQTQIVLPIKAPPD
jgi:1,4-dihydroxy-2-naphthoyl-CoA hydrolase